MEFGNIPITGGIIACGLFFFLISATLFAFCFCVGDENENLCFAWLICGIGLVSLILFSISIACLSGRDNKAEKVLSKQWEKYDTAKRDRNLKLRDAETYFGCCGLDESDIGRNMNDTVDDYWKDEWAHCFDNIPGCKATNTSSTTTTIQTTTPVPTTATPNTYPNLECPPCHDKMIEKIDSSLKTCGALGLSFSLLQVIALFVLNCAHPHPILHFLMKAPTA